MMGAGVESIAKELDMQIQDTLTKEKFGVEEDGTKMLLTGDSGTIKRYYPNTLRSKIGNGDFVDITTSIGSVLIRSSIANKVREELDAQRIEYERRDDTTLKDDKGRIISVEHLVFQYFDDEKKAREIEEEIDEMDQDLIAHSQ